MECPCVNCITLALCQNRKMFPLIKQCSLFSKYIVKSESSKGTVLHMSKLIEFCDYMKIKVNFNGEHFTMVYPWEVKNG
jgi:hypothetical protein